jgi:hypothetical protein
MAASESLFGTTPINIAGFQEVSVSTGYSGPIIVKLLIVFAAGQGDACPWDTVCVFHVSNDGKMTNMITK